MVWKGAAERWGRKAAREASVKVRLGAAARMVGRAMAEARREEKTRVEAIVMVGERKKRDEVVVVVVVW